MFVELREYNNLLNKCIKSGPFNKSKGVGGGAKFDEPGGLWGTKTHYDVVATFMHMKEIVAALLGAQ